MRRFFVISFACVLAVGLLSCSGGSGLDNTGVPVFLTVDITENNPDINVCIGGVDVAVTNMRITSAPKDPSGTLSANQDVNLRDWDVTPEREDGGTVTSPVWHTQQQVYVPAGGTATLENYRVYPSDYLENAPFNYLFPENGGFDPETGAASVRETLNLVISGRTVSGKEISTPRVPLQYHFYCN